MSARRREDSLMIVGVSVKSRTIFVMSSSGRNVTSEGRKTH